MTEVARMARAVVRGAGRAALATALARDGSARPYASLILACVDHDASPVLLLSDLADHAKNLKADPRASVLAEQAAPGRGAAQDPPEDPLSAPRVTVLGRVAEVGEPEERARLGRRFLARHPGAGTYASFGDFRFYRMAVESAHLVAGFGRVHWLSAEEFRGDTLAAPAAWRAPAAAEDEVLARLNRTHAAALRQIVRTLAPNQVGEATWTLVGIDPEGIDLRAGGSLIRAAFEAPISTLGEAGTALIHMANHGPRKDPSD